jgi:AcrR family transcriptional regulator
MSPRTAAQNEVIRKESRHKIMEAAFKLFVKNGFEATSIAMIAREAGVAKGLLYNYFTSKQDLLEQLVHSVIDIDEDNLGNLEAMAPKEALRVIMQWFFKEIREKADHWRLLTELTMKVERFDFVHKIVIDKMYEYIGLLEDIMTKLGYADPLGEARLIAALFDGIGVQALMARDDYHLEELEQFMMNKYCK